MAMKSLLWQMSASELAPLLAEGNVSPVELTHDALQRIDRINPAINAIVAINPRALDDARDSERRLRDGQARSQLEGIPLTVKDNIWVKGLPATWGSRVFADFIPEQDELPVSRLRAAGAIIVAKTNVPEFTLDGYTDNLLFGTTRNPWNTALTPGGSSGGAVASVAAGITAVAIGTDGGGSIRRPASHTGLVGVKPSIGLLARDHGFAKILLDFEVVGPIARTVADAELLMHIMSGPDPRDRVSLMHTAPAPTHRHPWHILYVPRFVDAPVDPEIAASVDSAAERFAELGHRVTTAQLPFDVEPIHARWPDVGRAAVAYLCNRYPQAKALMAERYIEMAQLGDAISAAQYLDFIETVDQFRRRVTSAYEHFDVIMTPSAAALPWPAEQAYPPEIDGRRVGPRGHAVFAAWVNACGHPAINLPCRPSASGLPIGFQLVGRFSSDYELLALAKEYEAASPWPSPGGEHWPALALE